MVKQIILNILYNIPGVHTDVKRDSVKAEIFRKIDRHLTLLSIHQLQRQGAYLRTVEELEELNQSLRQYKNGKKLKQ